MSKNRAPLGRILRAGVYGIRCISCFPLTLSAIAFGLILTAGMFTYGSAQRLDGTLQVYVTDQTGASVVGANVSATNEATGVTAKANGSGENTSYVFPNLLPGSYTVTVEQQGFKKFVRPNVQVLPNTVVDARAALEIGATSTTIEVQGGESDVRLTTSDITAGFTGAVAEALPITTIGGDVKELAVSLPNSTTQPGGINGSGGSFGGLRPRYNSFTIDGGDDNNLNTNGFLTPVIEDSVADFTVLANQFSAEYGHSAGAVFAITTKSGSNALHGEAHGYDRNRDFNAFDNLQKQRDLKDRYDYVRTGASAGGHIIKDRLFFFGAYEFQIEQLASSGPTVNTPTAAGLATLMTLAHDQAVKTILQQFAVAPTASGPPVLVNGVAIPVGTFQGLAPNFTKEHDFLINMDGNIGKHALRGRYLYDRQRQPQLNRTQPQPQFNGTRNTESRKLVLSDVWSIGPTLINEFRFSFTHAVGPQLTVPAAFANFPNVEVDSLGLDVGPDGCSPQAEIYNTYQWADNVTKVLGSHTVKFGAEVRNYIQPGDVLPRARGEWDYASLSTFINDLVPDGGNGALRGAGSGFFAANFRSYYGFIQDDWKFNRRLTLNLGLRYEFNGVPRDEGLQALNALANDPKVGLIFRKPRPDKNNWAPRVGFAYDPTGAGKWAIRGGAGVFFDITPVNFATNSLPPELQTEQNPTITCSLPSRPAWCTNIAAGFLQSGGLLQVNVPPTTPADARGATGSLMPDIVEPKIITWTLSVQRELGAKTSVEVRYLGTRGLSLPMQVRLNSKSAFDPSNPGGAITPLPTYLSASSIPATVVNPPSTLRTFNLYNSQPLASEGFFGNVTTFPPVGYSIYHGGSIDVVHRLTRGLYLRGNFTDSKTIDNGTAELFSTRVNPRRAQDGFNVNADRGRSALDIERKVSLAFVYNLPNLGVNNALARGFLHGWIYTGTYLAQTGQPVTALSNVDSNANGDSAADRTVFNPNGTGLTGTVSDFVCNDLAGGRTRVVTAAASCGTGNGANVVGYVARDPSARFVQARVGAVATTGRNTVDTPGLNVWNMSLMKTTRLTERFSFQFRVETYNTFNHRNFSLGLPTNNGTLDQASNPNPLSTAYPFVTAGNLFLNNAVFTGGSRRMQLGLKLIF